MVLHQIQSGEDELRAGAELARSKRLRGLILLGGCFDYTPEQIAALDIPFVCCTYTNSFGTLSQDSYSSVSIDDQKSAYRAVRMLTEHGHRKIAVILDSVRDHSISQLRYKGYLDALADRGIAFDPALLAESGAAFRMSEAYQATIALLDRGADFTAMFTLSDTMAMAAMKALADRGRHVPDDCSVIAIDGLETSQYTIPTLTTMVQPAEEMARVSVDLLMEMIRDGAKPRHVILDTPYGRAHPSVPCDFPAGRRENKKSEKRQTKKEIAS
jgi:LacI family transcriptional regulator